MNLPRISGLSVSAILSISSCGDDVAGTGTGTSGDTTGSPAPTSTGPDEPTPTSSPTSTATATESGTGSASASDTTAMVDPTTSTTIGTTTSTDSSSTTADTTDSSSTTTDSSSTTTDSSSTTTDTSSTTDTTGPGIIFDCDDGVAWARRITGDDLEQQVADLAVAPSGDVIMVGRFWGEVDFGGGAMNSNSQWEDAYIARFDPQGQHLWSRQFGDLDEQGIRGVALDGAGNILIVGTFRGTIDLGGGVLSSEGVQDIFAAKLAPDGTHLWSRSFGNAESNLGESVASDSAGNLVFIASSSDPLDFGGGSLGAPGIFSAHLVKLGNDGAHLWSRSYDAQKNNEVVYGRRVAVDPDDHIIAVGEFESDVDFGAGPVPANSDNSIFVTQLTPAGDLVWMRQSGGIVSYGKPFVTGVATDANGNIHLGGWFAGQMDWGGPTMFASSEYDAWVAALSPAGEHVWSRGTGDGFKKWQFVSDVASNAAGQTAVVGNFTGSVDFGGGPLPAVDDSGYDAFVARLEPDGSHSLSRSFGAPISQYGDTVAIADDGSIWLAGIFDQPFQAGDELLTPEGYDIYLIRLCP